MTKQKARFRAQMEIIISVLLLAVLTAALLFAMVLISHDSIDGLLKLLLTRDENQIAAYIRAEGLWRGILSVSILCIVQVITIFFPVMVINIAAGLIFPWWRAFPACYVGFVAGHTFVFLIVRMVVTWKKNPDEAGDQSETVAEQEDAEPESAEEEADPNTLKSRVRYLASRMRNANPVAVVMLSCFTPGMPNGIIPHIAARTPIETRSFVLAIAASGWLQILCSCLAGHFLLRGDYLFTVLSIAFQFGVMALVAWKRHFLLRHFYKKKDDTPQTDDPSS